MSTRKHFIQRLPPLPFQNNRSQKTRLVSLLAPSSGPCPGLMLALSRVQVLGSPQTYKRPAFRHGPFVIFAFFPSLGPRRNAPVQDF